MEVLSFFSTDNALDDKLDAFLSGYLKLKLNTESDGAKYYINPKTGRNEILNDIDHEFIRDYTESEQEYIKRFFNGDTFYFFDIQFRDEVFLQHLLKDFKDYLNMQNEYRPGNILISHPHKGIIELN